MAVVDVYVNTDTKFLEPQNNDGAVVKKSIVTYEIPTTHSAGSVVRLFKNINAFNKLSRITIMCDALTTAADNDLGYYKVDGGVAVDADCLMNGQTFASASRVLDGMSAVAIEKVGKRHYELAGETLNSNSQVYDICLTINTAATAAGTITVIMEQEVI